MKTHQHPQHERRPPDGAAALRAHVEHGPERRERPHDDHGARHRRVGVRARHRPEAGGQRRRRQPGRHRGVGLVGEIGGGGGHGQDQRHVEEGGQALGDDGAPELQGTDLGLRKKYSR